MNSSQGQMPSPEKRSYRNVVFSSPAKESTFLRRLIETCGQCAIATLLSQLCPKEEPHHCKVVCMVSLLVSKPLAPVLRLSVQEYFLQPSGTWVPLVAVLA